MLGGRRSVVDICSSLACLGDTLTWVGREMLKGQRYLPSSLSLGGLRINDGDEDCLSLASHKVFCKSRKSLSSMLYETVTMP